MPEIDEKENQQIWHQALEEANNLLNDDAKHDRDPNIRIRGYIIAAGYAMKVLHLLHGEPDDQLIQKVVKEALEVGFEMANHMHRKGGQA